MWLKLSKRHKLLFVEETTALYRIHGHNSYDTMKKEMLQAARMLIAREREYCSRHGLTRAWRASFNHQLYRLLRHGDFPLKDKLHEFKFAEALSFIGFLLRARRNTIMRKFIRKTSKVTLGGSVPR